MRRILLTLLCLAGLTGCAADADLDGPVEPLGEFRLGYTIVVADGASKIPPSRDATAEEWEASLKSELGRRFGRFEGRQLYHLAVKVDAYALAVPGVPVVLSPKSLLRLQVSVWDDAAGGKINAEPRVFNVFERFSGETVLGSGLTRTREEQMQQLSANAARKIEAWLRENPGWFAPGARSVVTLPAVPEAAATTPGVSPDIDEVITPAQ